MTEKKVVGSGKEAAMFVGIRKGPTVVNSDITNTFLTTMNNENV